MILNSHFLGLRLNWEWGDGEKDQKVTCNPQISPLKFLPLNSFFSQRDSSPESSCIKESGCSRIPQEWMGWGGVGALFPLAGFGSRDIGLAGCEAQKKYPLQLVTHRCNAAPLCGRGPAWQMARSRIGDGLSIKRHFLGVGDLAVARRKEECRGPPLLA